MAQREFRTSTYYIESIALCNFDFISKAISANSEFFNDCIDAPGTYIQTLSQSHFTGKH